ncbi:MAG: DUF4340 domain-containing protein [Clostridia bacterium]|nr:DUF4340 domain-containing protein [Clostridia bacterium]
MAVRKRYVRSERKKRRWILSALIAVLVFAVAAVIFYVNREEELPPIEYRDVSGVTFENRQTEEIASVTVKNAEGEYTVVKNGENWQMAGREDFEFSEAMLEVFLGNAALIYAEEKLMEIPGSGYTFTDFGLGDNGIRVQVAYTDGASRSFYIGSLVPQETPVYYFRVEGDTGLYTVTQDVQETFALSGDALHRVTDPAIKGDLIDEIAFSGENPFTVTREGDEWYLTAPFRYPLNTAKVNKLLEKLEGLRFAQFVSKAEKADLSACGLSPARRTVTLAIAPSVLTGYDENGQPIADKYLEGYALSFLCGDDIGDILFYCLYRGEVVKATRFSSGVLLTQDYESLLQTAPFAVAVSSLTRFEWEEKGQTRAWDITLHERLLPNNEFERDASGNILYDLRAEQDGIEGNTDEFLLAFSRLIDVKAENLLPDDYAAPKEHEIRITLFRGENRREVKLYPYGELHYAVSVDGETVFYMSRDALSQVKFP